MQYELGHNSIGADGILHGSDWVKSSVASFKWPIRVKLAGIDMIFYWSIPVLKELWLISILYERTKTLRLHDYMTRDQMN